MTQSLVSIGLPVYNGARFIRRAIESVQAQTLDDWRMVVCDNCSTDETADIVREIASADARIYYHRNHANIGARRNFTEAYLRSGISRFYITLPADDVWEPRFLERGVEALTHQPIATLAFSHVRSIDADGGYLGIDTNPFRSTPGGEPTDRLARALRPFWGSVVYALFRRDSLPGNYLLHDDPGMWPELHLLARLALRGPFYLIPEPLYCRRMHDGNLHIFNATPMRFRRAIRILGEDLMPPLTPMEVACILITWYWRHGRSSPKRGLRGLGFVK